MFDTMTLTKAGGALCGSLLVFLLGNWAAESLYHVGGGGHGEGAEQAYVIDTGETGGETEETVEVDVTALLAAGDADAGSKVFKKCAGCHKVEKGANGTGPYLYDVVGRAVGAADGFGGYSGALSEHADVWTPENLFAFLEDPKGFAPGNKMSFKGLPKPTDRANLIAYLDSLDN